MKLKTFVLMAALVVGLTAIGPAKAGHYVLGRYALGRYMLGHYVLSAQQVTKESREGIKNFARVETTVACAGAITTDAMPEIKKMGFASVINVRQASEPGADIPQHEAAAKAAGLRYYHIPMNGSKPDPKTADEFLQVISAKDANPAFIHCASANRASALWLIKRILVDKWDEPRALAEAEALGLTSPVLRQWALEYARSR